MRSIRIVGAILVLMMSLALLVTGFITLAKASSGSPVIEWTTTYGAQAVVQTEDGGYLFAGSALGLLVKADSLGNIEWNRTYEGISNPLSIFETAGGGYVATGCNWLLKVDVLGNILLNKTYEVGASCVVQTGDGGYIFVGNILLKIDAFGDIQWSKPIEGSWVAESEGGYITSSQVESSGLIVRLIRTDTEGIVEWNETCVLIDPSWPGVGASLLHMIGTNDGGIALTAWVYVGPGSSSLRIYKINSSGEKEWESGVLAYDRGGDIMQTVDGGYAMTGQNKYTASNAFLIKINQTGDFQWKISFGPDECCGSAVIETSEGGFVVTTAQHVYKFSPSPRHNIAISEITVPSFEIEEGHILPANVTVQNDGDYNETTEVFLYDNSALIDTQNVTLLSGTSDTITFFWNTTGVGLGQHNILANATLAGETYLGDNTGQTTVSIMGGSKISINTVSSVSPVIGFFVNVSGTLTDRGETTISGGLVFLYYKIHGAGTWKTITSVHSGTNGLYSAIWVPTATGSFTLKADCNGNATHFGTSNTATLYVDPVRTISISLSSSTSLVGFKVEINGALTCNDVALSGAPVLLSYSVTGGESWNDITLVDTISGGGYSAEWIPTATGNYLDSIYPRTSITVNLAVISFEEQNVFSVASNSTVSELAFNSTDRVLSFMVTGPSGTTGYVNVYLAKILIANIAEVDVYLNGDQLNHTATLLDDSWLLRFTYQHSAHKVTISLGAIATFIETPLGKAIIYGVPLIAMIVLTIIYILKKRESDEQIPQ